MLGNGVLREANLRVRQADIHDNVRLVNGLVDVEVQTRFQTGLTYVCCCLHLEGLMG